MAYTRVNWEDLPSTNTPRNATNLNKMDAGIKANADDITDLKGYVLFESTAGTSQNVSLSDNITNYKYIEVYFNASNSRGYNSIKIPASATTMFLSTGFIGSTYKYNYNAYYTLSGNTMTLSYYDTEQIHKSNSTLTVTTTSNDIFITKVVGYK